MNGFKGCGGHVFEEALKAYSESYNFDRPSGQLYSLLLGIVLFVSLTLFLVCFKAAVINNYHSWRDTQAELESESERVKKLEKEKKANEKLQKDRKAAHERTGAQYKATQAELEFIRAEKEKKLEQEKEANKKKLKKAQEAEEKLQIMSEEDQGTDVEAKNMAANLHMLQQANFSCSETSRASMVVKAIKPVNLNPKVKPQKKDTIEEIYDQYFKDYDV